MSNRELINKICDELHNYQYGNTALENLKILGKIAEYADEKLSGCLSACNAELNSICELDDLDEWEQLSDEIIMKYAKEIADLCR